jgi:hypothetical protein
VNWAIEVWLWSPPDIDVRNVAVAGVGRVGSGYSIRTVKAVSCSTGGRCAIFDDEVRAS